MHLTGVEEFELPTKEQFLYLGLNGLIGTVGIDLEIHFYKFQVICELIWIYACFLTSPLQGTLALSLINPGSILADYVSAFYVKLLYFFLQLLHGQTFGQRFFLGSALNLVGYLGIASFNQPRKRAKPIRENRFEPSQNHELDELISK